VSAFFNYLERQKPLVPNPMRQVPKPKVGEYLIRPFSEEQVRRLLEQPDVETFIGLRDRTLMCFLLDTGCRVSESLALTFDDFDCERRLARVFGKGRKERLVPFGCSTLAWLNAYLERRRESMRTSFVFVNQYGERLTRTAVTHRIATYGRRADLRGVRVSPHTFRHTFGVNWLVGEGEYKGDALSLQQILGHSSPTMTQRYVYLAGQDLRHLHDRLSPADRLVEPPGDKRRQRLR
jgi:integrase/recombinase XerD